MDSLSPPRGDFPSAPMIETESEPSSSAATTPRTNDAISRAESQVETYQAAVTQAIEAGDLEKAEKMDALLEKAMYASD